MGIVCVQAEMEDMLCGLWCIIIVCPHALLLRITPYMRIERIPHGCVCESVCRQIATHMEAHSSEYGVCIVPYV